MSILDTTPITGRDYGDDTCDACNGWGVHVSTIHDTEQDCGKCDSAGHLGGPDAIVFTCWNCDNRAARPPHHDPDELRWVDPQDARPFCSPSCVQAHAQRFGGAA